jgi:hypothetical protein
MGGEDRYEYWLAVALLLIFTPLTLFVISLRRKKEARDGTSAPVFQVAYKGGHPDYPKAKPGFITCKVCADAIELSPTKWTSTKKWFKGLRIPFAQIAGLEVVERQLGGFEVILGGLNSRQLNQRNNIHVAYRLDDGTHIVLRLEMLSGWSVWGQARKCRELIDWMQMHGIFDRFQAKANASSSEGHSMDDIPTQIKKLAALHEEGIVTGDEFSKKKADLLSRM